MHRLPKAMTSRRRFVETMRYGSADRVPYFEEGLRTEVLDRWRSRGMPPDLDVKRRFVSDPRVEIEPVLEPRPALKQWPTTRKGLEEFRKRLDARDPGRLPRNWARRVRTMEANGSVRMLRVHRGLFLSMGVHQWDRFYELMLLLGDEPERVHAAMKAQGEFAAAMAERVLSDTAIEAAIFSEPIGGNDRPLISPDMYEDIVLDSYRPVLRVLQRRGVETVVFRTYANARILLPRILKFGFNCLWACEVNIGAMDYRDLRSEFGRELRLIGGIDLDALRFGKQHIEREVREKVPPLLKQGGYVPLADGRVREDVPYENYLYYRQLLETLTSPAK